MKEFEPGVLNQRNDGLSDLQKELGSLRSEEAALMARLDLTKDLQSEENRLNAGSMTRDEIAKKSETEVELSEVRTRRVALEQNHESEVSRLSKLAGNATDMYLAQQKYLLASKTLEKLEERVASIRTERQKDSTIQTLSKAIDPTTPDESIPWRRMSLVASIVLVISLCVGLLNFANTAMWKIWGRPSI